jgi:hypothetical protein
VTYVSAGAQLHTDDRFAWCPSKKALREALEANPGRVMILTYGLGGHPPVQPEHLVAGTRYQLAGPDPKVSRRWFATLENRDGVLYLDNKAVKGATA